MGGGGAYGALVWCLVWGLLISWYVLGGVALSEGMHQAEDCGWWLWCVFVGQLIYLPFAVALSGVYGAGIIKSFRADGDPSSADMRPDSCTRAAAFLMLNCMNCLGLGFGGKALWSESCIPHNTLLGVLSQTAFYTFAVCLAVSVILGVVEATRPCCT